MNGLASAASALQLGIYVPAYKRTFLRESLASICSQTDQRFNLYVGDDASPEALADVVSEFAARRPICYHRFDDNLGSKSLVKQWSRCLALGNEPWVWLFSDDDVMDPQCVSRFYEVLAETGGRFDVYRFNHKVITARGAEAYSTIEHPETETGFQFACSRLEGVRYGFAQEVVFSRDRFERIGGYMEFPLAWASDDATLILMAGQRGMYTISGPIIHWRLSGENITSLNDYRTSRLKTKAAALFVGWLLDNLPKLDAERWQANRETIVSAAQALYRSHVDNLAGLLSFGDMWEISGILHRIWGISHCQSLDWLLRQNLRKVKRHVRARLPLRLVKIIAACRSFGRG